MNEFALGPGMDRHRFLRATSVAFAALVASGCRARIHRTNGASDTFAYGPLVADPWGFLDLPSGWRYQVLSQLGDPMDDGLTNHEAACVDPTSGSGACAARGGFR